MVFSLLFFLCLFSNTTSANDEDVPLKVRDVVKALNATQWDELEEGLSAIRTLTQNSISITAFRISPENFDFAIELQDDPAGSGVREIGEQVGAVVISNAGFFAVNNASKLFPIGYLRLNNETLSKGWKYDGGTLSLKDGAVELSPTHAGIPQGEFNVIQSKPMLIEPGGKWAMSSNSGLPKPRTMICTLANGDIILATVNRAGLTLYEAGWVMRNTKDGGFFNCDAALAFDGGRSTQIWYSGDEKYYYRGISPVHNFFVVTQKEN